MGTGKDKLDIGPGSLLQVEESKSPFLLKSAEWIPLQRYVEDGLHLPNTEAKMRESLLMQSEDDITPFKRIIDAYGEIYSHCETWKHETFPNIVSLADDIVHYATEAKTYYGPINPLADKLDDNPEDERTKKKLKAIIDKLAEDANRYADNADKVYKDIEKFAEEAKRDKRTIGGERDGGGLVKYANDRFGETSDEVEMLRKEEDAQNAILNAANAEYDHDKVVAATTPTYVWVYPFGTIAAGVVAGVYGDRAVKALERAKKAREQINRIGGILARNANLICTMQSALKGLKSILCSIDGALPVIGKIQGCWRAIKSDLDCIGVIIEEDIRERLPIIMSLGVDAAIEQWSKLSAEADNFRVHAFIEVEQT